MHILFVTDFYKPHIGGVEKLFSSLAEELASKGEKISYITWRYNSRLPRRENINGVNVIRVPAPSRMLFSLAALPQIIREARKADIIHTSTYSSAIGAWVGGKITRKKVILTVHEVWGNLWVRMPFLATWEKRFFRLFERWLLRLQFDHYIAVSDFTRDKLIETGIIPEKVSRIYNGIDYDLPAWKDPGTPFTFCFFGRAGASKGLDILISATQTFSKQYPAVRFKFIVSPQTKKVFRKVHLQVTSSALAGCSTFYSNLPYPALLKELLSSNCIIIPSLCEGFGFTAVEASAMGIPILSSGMGSLPEVVSGKVIQMEDYSVEALFEAMKKALKEEYITEPERKFSIHHFISNHLFLYDKLLIIKANS